jgi:hypothetical protein
VERFFVEECGEIETQAQALIGEEMSLREWARKQVRRRFYHRGTRKDDRVHGVGKWLRFARCFVGLLREALQSLLLRVLNRASLFLCDKNTFLIA